MWSVLHTNKQQGTTITAVMQPETVFAVYLLVSYMCAKIRVWSCLVTGNFGLFTEILVCKFLRGWRAYSPNPFFLF